MKTHVPMRECVCCGKKAPKWEMLRFVKQDGNISVDLNGKQEGRGAYVCNDEKCREQLVQRKRLNRAFRQTVTQEEYARIAEEMR